MRQEPSPFGTLLAHYRAAAGLTQEELAERAGLSRRGISDLERGERRLPHPATTRRLAEALSLDQAQLATLLQATRQPSTVGLSSRSSPVAPSAMREVLPTASGTVFSAPPGREAEW